MKAPSPDGSYTLCTLVNREDAPIQFSPYVWTTIIELRYLGVKFTQEAYTFHGIRTTLRQGLEDETALVPVLKDSEGDWIQDSFEVGQYLDKTHAVPQGKTLFLDGEGGRELCRFLSFWGEDVLYPLIGPITKARAWASLPPSSPSHTYFTGSRYGTPAAASAALADTYDPSFLAAQFAAARKGLKPLNSMLAHQHTQGKRFIGGEFSHADAAVFGWYMWSIKFAPEFREGVWETDENAAVREWVGAMRGLEGWEEGEFGRITA